MSNVHVAPHLSLMLKNINLLSELRRWKHLIQITQGVLQAAVGIVLYTLCARGRTKSFWVIKANDAQDNGYIHLSGRGTRAYTQKFQLEKNLWKSCDDRRDAFSI